MITKKEENFVYAIAGIGTLAILWYNLKAGFNLDGVLLILKDLAALVISVWVFVIVEGTFNPNYKRAAKKTVTKLRERYADVFYERLTISDSINAEHCLFLRKNQPSFIPIKGLESGELEIRVSYATLANFDYPIKPNDPPDVKETKISNVKNFIRIKATEILLLEGAKCKILEVNDAAIHIKFLSEEGFERIVENIVGAIIVLLKEKQGC